MCQCLAHGHQKNMNVNAVKDEKLMGVSSDNET